MLESFRSHRRWLMFFLLALVFPSFVVTGIYGYSRFSDTENAVAQVDGKAITAQDLDRAQRVRIDQMRSMMGANFDPAMLDSPAARAETLEQVLSQRALEAESQHQHVSVSAERLREVIAGIPAFQVEGKFNYERYRSLLAAQGRSEPAFEAEVRAELVQQQLLQGVASSAFVPRTVVERINRVALESREVREQRFEPASFASQVVVTDDAIKTYYETNRARFETPESLRIEYLVLTPADILAQIGAPEAELRSYYDQNVGPKFAERSAARKTAEGLLAQVKAAPDKFAELAQKNSRDEGSAARGGDLGFFRRGMMAKPFEEVAFRLRTGELSPTLVETEFGFHILRLDAIRKGEGGVEERSASHILIAAPQAQSFEDAHQEIEAAYRAQQAQRKFAEAAEQFTNLVYENADSLQPAADKLKLQVRKVDALTRAGLPAVPGAPQFINRRLLQSLFADESIRARRNTEAIEVAPNTLVAARVVEHRPAALRPLDQVREEVRAAVVEREAQRLAQEAAKARMAELKAFATDKGFGPPRMIARSAPTDLPPEAVKAIMQAPADRLPAFTSAAVGGGAYGVFKVVAVKAAEPANAQQREATGRAIERQAGVADDEAYLAMLRVKYKAKVLKTEPAAEAAPAPSSTGPASPASPASPAGTSGS